MESAARRRQIEVRPDWPQFVGHFEGRPILPGIAHLALVRDALRHLAGPEVELVGVSVLRLRQVVVPGDRLDLEVSARSGSEWAFELRLGGGLASQGRVAAGCCRSLDGGACGAAAGEGRFPPPEELIPHRGPALLLSEVEEVGEDRLVARAGVPPGSPFAARGAAAPLVALEIAAQAAAAYEAVRRRRAGGETAPRVGYLVGARDAGFEAALPVGSPVRVTIRLDAAVPPLSTYRFEVGAAGIVAARGTISTYMA